MTPFVWLPVGLFLYVAALLLREWIRTRHDPPTRPHGHATAPEEA
jgi:hypothetical protein